MKTTILILILAVGAIACPSIPVSGRVLRSENGRGIVNAQVFFISGIETYIAVTGRFGRYQIGLPNCREYQATAVAEGYWFNWQKFALPNDEEENIVIDFIANP